MLKSKILLIAVLSSFLTAEVFNKVDKDYDEEDNETGMHFYKEEKELKKVEIQVEEITNTKQEQPVDKKDLLLTKILLEMKKQKKSLNKMKDFINPNEAKMIINSKGEECLSNSNDDCILIPITQEARNVPALKNLIENPTPENAVTWLKVQAKFFNHYRDIGFALRFASLNGTEDDYGVSGGDIYTSPKDNFNNEQFRTKILQILKENEEKVGTLFLLGKTPKIEDVWGMQSLSRLVFKKGKYFNSAIAFYNEESKKKYDNFYSRIHDRELFEAYKNIPKVVNPELFKKYNGNVSPTVVSLYKKDKDKKPIFSVLAKGFVTQREIIHSYHNFLVYNKIVEPKEFHSAKLWEASIDE